MESGGTVTGIDQGPEWNGVNARTHSRAHAQAGKCIISNYGGDTGRRRNFELKKDLEEDRRKVSPMQDKINNTVLFSYFVIR